MSNINYADVVKEREPKFNLRLRIAQGALTSKNVSQTAQLFGTTRKTVRKWRRRYLENGSKGLSDLSKAPKHIPHKIPKELEEKIVNLRKRFRSWGPERLKDQFGLSCSTWAIYRVLKEHGLNKRYRKRKHKKKQDLRLLKAKYRPFELIQVDVKDLEDIPNYWPNIKRYNLPLHQYTARDVKTGATFLSFSYEANQTNSSIFLTYLAEQLKAYGVKLASVTIQTDNGAEFAGSWLSKAPSGFTQICEGHFKIRHQRIPPHRSTYNSDVEALHSRIEEEFYDIEEFSSSEELLAKAYAYQIYFNCQRTNRYKNKKTPLDILKESNTMINACVLVFMPVILDKLIDTLKPTEGGYYLPILDKNLIIFMDFGRKTKIYIGLNPKRYAG